MPGKTVWVDTMLDLQVGNGSSNAVSLITDLSFVEIRMSQLTVMRTIIGIDVAHLIHDSGEGSQDVSIGIGVASQDAFSAGGASLPDPAVQGDFPTRGWVWRARFRVYGFAADQAAVFNRRIDLDIRARRKLDNGESFIKVTNTVDQGTSGTINAIGLIRQLWLVS